MVTVNDFLAATWTERRRVLRKKETSRRLNIWSDAYSILTCEEDNDQNTVLLWKMFQIIKVFMSSAGAFIALEILQINQRYLNSIKDGQNSREITFIELNAGNCRRNFDSDRRIPHANNIV